MSYGAGRGWSTAGQGLMNLGSLLQDRLRYREQQKLAAAQRMFENDLATKADVRANRHTAVAEGNLDLGRRRQDTSEILSGFVDGAYRPEMDPTAQRERLFRDDRLGQYRLQPFEEETMAANVANTNARTEGQQLANEGTSDYLDIWNSFDDGPTRRAMFERGWMDPRYTPGDPMMGVPGGWTAPPEGLLRDNAKLLRQPELEHTNAFRKYASWLDSPDGPSAPSDDEPWVPSPFFQGFRGGR